jgi:hypothetical protein
MDRVEELLGFALKALLMLEKLVNLPNPSDVERDAAIQRFEYTFETYGKPHRLTWPSTNYWKAHPQKA